MESNRIDVSNLGLDDLSHIPSSVTELRCSKNQITSLKSLEHLAGLTNLGCSFTHVENFLGCPSTIKKIVAAFCKISSFQGLPNKMDILYVSYNRLTSFEFCPSVTILDVSCNLFQQIDFIPEGIQELCLSNNHLLRELPKKWPKSLKILRLSGCAEISDESYESIPSSLSILEVSKNSERCLKFVDRWFEMGIKEVIV